MEEESLSFIKLSGITIIIIVLAGSSMALAPNDFRIHDTFFVVDSFIKGIVAILITVFFSSLVAAILTKFRNRFYIKTFAFSLFLIFCFAIYIFSSLYVKH